MNNNISEPKMVVLIQPLQSSALVLGLKLVAARVETVNNYAR